MRELTKAEIKQVKELLRKGILRRHSEWLDELRELLGQPYDNENGNEFDRSMMITDRSREFYKEAMRMEDYYRTRMLPFGMRQLYNDGYLTEEDISPLPDDIKDWMKNS